MASLTKVMTALVSIMLAEELNLNMSSTYFTVSKSAAGCCGTTAFLVTDQKIRLIDLLYGLMLPSGNDAALTLAENFGRLMRSLKRICPKKACKVDKNGQLETSHSFGGDYVDTFVKEMNRVAKHVVHLRRTNYANPHGLADRSNHSTAFELALLASHAMKIPEFAKIVNTKQYTAVSYLPKARVEKHFCKLKTLELEVRDYPLPFTPETDGKYCKFV